MEVAPGVYLSSFVPKGKVFRMDLAALGLPGEGRGWAIHPDDWARCPPAEREMVLDSITRVEAEAGIRRLERWLSERSQ